MAGGILKPLAEYWRILAAVEAQTGVDVGMDSRSMAQQTGTPDASIERIILASRYTAALKASDFDRVLETASNLAAASGKATASEGTQNTAATELLQSALTDIILFAKLSGTLDGGLIDRVGRSARAIFGENPTIGVILRAASEIYAVGPSSPRAVMLVAGIVISDEKAAADPARRLHRDLMTAHHIMYSLAGADLAEIASGPIAAGWTNVADDQGFLLLNPVKNVPVLRAAVSKEPTRGLPTIAEILVAASQAVRHPFAQEWIDQLAKHRGVG